MIWVAWRQHRQQIFSGAIVLVVFAAFFLLTGFGIADEFTRSGLGRCLATGSDNCGALAESFDRLYSRYQILIPLFLLMPVLVGMFWGAPMVAREIERGTHRLAWTQGVSRRRWIVTKVGLVTLAAMAASAAYVALVTWWSRPLVTASQDRFVPGIFDLRGVVPIAYTVFALLLGVAIGSLITKSLPAIGVTIAVFTAVRVAITAFLRPHYLPAEHLVFSFGAPRPNGALTGWILSENTIDRTGAIVSHGGGLEFGYLASRCPGVAAQASALGKGSTVIDACVQRLGLQDAIVYHPDARFWTFQWIEAGVYIAMALALAGFILWRIKRLS
jgi:ABC-type transport system involved in multi-copper enzyme maturation permease subunit